MSARIRVIGALVITAVLAIGLGMAGQAESHPGHPQKKLFDERWHDQPNGDYDAWMNLSTSDVWLNCAGSEEACGAAGVGPFTGAMAGWTGRPRTGRRG